VPISRHTKKVLRQLAITMAGKDEPLNRKTVGAGGYRTALVPANLTKDKETQEYLAIWGKKSLAFIRALRSLEAEPELEHLEPREIETRLWAFVCELELKHGGSRSERVAAFLEDTAKPHTIYEVIVPIHNIAVEKPMQIHDVRFEHWGADEIRELAGPPPEDFANKTVASVLVPAGSVEKEVDRARTSIDGALNLLRFGHVTSINVRVHDYEVLFRQGSAYLIAQEGGRQLRGWDWSSRAVFAKYPETFAERVEKTLAPIELLLAGSRAETALVQRFSLAVHWLGSSMTSTDYDEKIILLCTALEAILTEKSDDPKGELIALRAMLLQVAAEGVFIPTVPLLLAYELRSDVVHGSAIGRSGEDNYHYLFDMTARLITQAVDLLNNHPEITSFKQFRQLIEDPERLKNAIWWLEHWGENERRIAVVARRLLQKNASAHPPQE